MIGSFIKTEDWPRIVLEQENSNMYFNKLTSKVIEVVQSLVVKVFNRWQCVTLFSKKIIMIVID